MSDCTHDCSSRGRNYGEYTVPQDFHTPANGLSHIGKIIAVVSGKSGMGKNLVTSPLAMVTRRMGKIVGVLDTDITGLSTPTALGVHTEVEGSELDICPTETRTGIKIMSLSLLIGNKTDPVVWRGPVIAGTVKQFWTDVIWGGVDYLFVDISPGTGDVSLAVFQSLPVGGIVAVTTPQDLVSMIAARTIEMTEMIYISILGLMENHSHSRCPDCGKEYAIFGGSHIGRVAIALGLKVPARLSIDPAVAAVYDAGRIEELDPNYLTVVAELLVE